MLKMEDKLLGNGNTLNLSTEKFGNLRIEKRKHYNF